MKQADLDQLWGSVIESWSLRPADLTLTARVAVVENGVRTRYEVIIGGIREFHFKNDGPSDWEHVELTSIELATAGRDEEPEIALEFWNGIASARLRGTSIDIVPL